MRLLIAEDDSALRAAMRLVLTDAGHEVLEAATVEEARAAAGGGSVDVALVDAGMDGRGVELWRDLQADATTTRAWLLTGDVLALGALKTHPDVVSKPFDYDALLERIRSLQ